MKHLLNGSFFQHAPDLMIHWLYLVGIQFCWMKKFSLYWLPQKCDLISFYKWQRSLILCQFLSFSFIKKWLSLPASFRFGEVSFKNNPFTRGWTSWEGKWTSCGAKIILEGIYFGLVTFTWGTALLVISFIFSSSGETDLLPSTLTFLKWRVWLIGLLFFSVY